MRWRKVAEEYLGFSRKERTGMISLLLIILIIYLIPAFYSKLRPVQPIVSTELLAFIDSAQLPGDPVYQDQALPERTPAVLFAFDPNTVSVEEWTRLGLPLRVAKTIEKYRQKGGRFYQAADLQKIWGLPPGFYERVKEHISINPTKYGASNYHQRSEPYPEKPVNRVEIIDINKADTAAWISLPWIGEKLAGRIVAFREKLGGFYSVDQVAETYGLPDSNFQKIRLLIKVDPGTVKKINLNTATKEELKSHPYIKWNLANAIVNYREQHGLFGSVDELKKIALVDEAAFGKISPYFTAQ